MKTQYEKIIEYFGGVPGLAKALDIRPQAIYQWGGHIPRQQALEIERMTDKKFNADIICPKNGRAA